MQRKELESVIKPFIEDATQKFLGVKIDSLNKDLSQKLTMPSLLSIPINTALAYKKAKKNFKIDYIRKMLILNHGNISEVARKLDVDRRSIHRLISQGKIDVDKIRIELPKVYNVKVNTMTNVIEDVLGSYKEIIHPKKYEQMQNYAPTLSGDIIKGVPEESLSLKEAEEEFEKRYLKKALEENKGNISQTSKKIGLRYETLHRKIKEYGLA